MPDSAPLVNTKPGLVRCEPAHAEAIYRWLLSHARNLTQPIDAISFAEFKENVFDSSHYFYWADQKTIFALAFLGRFDQLTRSAEFGIVALPQGKGYGLEATQALFKHAFDVLGLHRLYCLVNEDNLACLKAIKKLALLKNEGRTRQSRFVQGRFIDQMLFSRLATD